MRWLSDQLHAKGLKFGVYTDISLHTCGGSGSMGHYKIDAETYAHDWQVDYLKVDYCGYTAGPTNLTSGYLSYQPQPQYDAWMALGKELNATGRQIYYSICPHRPVKPTDGLPSEWAGDIAYVTFRLDFHRFDRLELDLRGRRHVQGAAFSCVRLKSADIVLI